jgi:hypothetical protein
VLLLVLALVFWNLAGVAKTDSLLIRPILGLFCLNFLALAILAGRFFTLGPIVIELLIVASFAAAFLTATAAEMAKCPRHSQ